MAATEINNGLPPVRNSPWGNLPKTSAPPSFSALMDEEYAKEVQKEEISLPLEIEKVEEIQTVDSSIAEDTNNDLLMAQLMQLEFNKEYDEFIKAKEKNFNKQSNVTLSFEKYRYSHPFNCENDDSPDYDEDDDDSLVDESEVKFSSKHSAGSGKEMVTKHDAVVCGRKNAKFVENFPPTFAAGDVSSKDLDIKLPNHVYNTLKTHSIKEEKYSHRVRDRQEHATHDQAIDPKTRIMLYKLVNGEVLDSISGCISTGKEAVVFHAKGGQCGEDVFPNECAIKVYKTTLIEFKTRDKYIKDDFRFRDRYSKQNPRKIVRLWAEKEMRNLKRMYERKINCPQVLLLRKHILVMNFIGHNQKPAPKIKDAKLSTAGFSVAYEQCIVMMKKMFQECNLIHADLSEYNMLWHDDRLWFIDVSQSIEPTHPRALEFLVRDCTNVVGFFQKVCQSDVMSVEQLFNYVSGLDIVGKEEDFLNQIRDYEKNEELLANGVGEKDSNFDYLFDISKSEKSSSLDCNETE